MIEQGFWNGLPTEIERGTAVVHDSGQFPLYWAKTEGIVGERIAVVRVVMDGVNYGGGTRYLDDRNGQGYAKVAGLAKGGPGSGHADVDIEDGSFVAAQVDGSALADARVRVNRAIEELLADPELKPESRGHGSDG